MRAKYARAIRDGIDSARREFAKGIPPRPDVWMVVQGPPSPLEDLRERAYRRTWERFKPKRVEQLLLPMVPGRRTND